jgi:hypothetical protein
VKSKPVYGMLEPDRSARHHLLMTRGCGMAAARRFADAHPEISLQTLDLSEEASWEARILDALRTVGMETAFYLSGPEAFLWQVTRFLRNAGVGRSRIHQEAAGSLARNVYCVHCRTMNWGVSTTIHRCVRCGIALMVRDHFSRPLGAYMGVIIDAETPGNAPEPEVKYQ